MWRLGMMIVVFFRDIASSLLCALLDDEATEATEVDVFSAYQRVLD